ncbi:MAG: CbiX/SirB N-terminal domain-containing protein [Akkermansia sp.]|nr:CbiX/SirB N-terminal domain-containing protein [Akkermansia sp.]
MPRPIYTATMRRHIISLLLSLCAVIFCTALVGSVQCGLELSAPGLSPERAAHLRGLIYFHFALAQLAVIATGVVLYIRHRRWRRYYLLVSYNEKGQNLNPPGIRMPSARVYRCHLGNLSTCELPPAGAPVLVYPMFMLSGHSSGHKLEHALTAAYAARGNSTPNLYYQPVLGASPWLAKAAAAHIRPLLQSDTGVLVVAHGSKLSEAPPEPALFCRRLRELLPDTEVEVGYFSQQPEAHEKLRTMRSAHVLLLPFLLTEGIHTTRDLPTPEQAATCGKQLTRLPVVATLLARHNDTP